MRFVSGDMDVRAGVQAGNALLDRLAHDRTLVGIVQARLKILRATLAELGGDHFGGQRSTAGDIGILIGANDLPLSASLVDESDGVGGFTPISRPEGFQMGDMDRDGGFAADGQSFGDGGQETGAFVAHVAGIKAVMTSGHFRQSDDFRRRGIAAGRVVKAGG